MKGEVIEEISTGKGYRVKFEGCYCNVACFNHFFSYGSSLSGRNSGHNVNNRFPINFLVFCYVV